MRAKPLPEDPLAAWFELIERKAGNPLPPGMVLGLALTLCGLPLVAVLWAHLKELLAGETAGLWQQLPEVLRLGGGVALAAVLLIVPPLTAFAYGRAFHALRRNGGMVDLLGSGLDPAQVVRGFLNQGLQRTLQALRPGTLLALGFLVAGQVGTEFGWALLPLAWLPLWLPLALALAAWAATGRRGPGWLAGMAMAAFAATALVAALASVLVGIGALGWFVGPMVRSAVWVVKSVSDALVGAGVVGWPGGLALGLGTSSVLAVAARALALQGADPESRCRRLVARLERPSRDRSWRDRTDNAMLFRGRAVRSGSLAARLQRSHAIAVVAVGLLFVYGPDLALVLVALVGVAVALLALFSASASLLDERQQGTLEVLQQSPMTVREYVTGRVRSATEAGAADVLVAAGAAFLALLFAGDLATAGLVAYAALCGLTALDSAAAYGTMAAADCRERLKPLYVFVSYTGAVTFAVWLFTPLTSAATFAFQQFHAEGPIEFLISPGAALAVPIALAALSALARTSARQTLLQRRDHPGFLS